MPVAHARPYIDAVYRVATHGHRELRCRRGLIVVFDGQVVLMTRLVIDHADRARRARAERVLRSCVSGTSWPQQANVTDGLIRSAPTRPVRPAFAAARANVPVSTVAAAAAASPVLSNNVISPPWMNDSPIHQVLVFLLPAPGTTAIALRKVLPGEPGAERRGRPASAL